MLLLLLLLLLSSSSLPPERVSERRALAGVVRRGGGCARTDDDSVTTMSGGGGRGGLLLGVASQLLWGCYPPLSRYLQRVAGMGTCQLMSVSNLLGLCTVFASDVYVGARACAARGLGPEAGRGAKYARLGSRGNGAAGAADGAGKETEMVAAGAAGDEEEGEALLAAPRAEDTNGHAPGGARDRTIFRILRENWREMGAFCVVLLLRALSTLYSTRYAPAAWVQMVNLSTPIFVAVLSWLRGEVDIPISIYPTIISSSGGRYLAIRDRAPAGGGAGAAAGGSSAVEFTGETVLGLGLAFSASFFLSLYMIVVRATKG
ncbi:MAG: hypothetical protein VX563_09275, partial [Planctomycetota bacterium]|nr:hypothetical protein [Planctomycetota bacterium]